MTCYYCISGFVQIVPWRNATHTVTKKAYWFFTLFSSVSGIDLDNTQLVLRSPADAVIKASAKIGYQILQCRLRWAQLRSLASWWKVRKFCFISHSCISTLPLGAFYLAMFALFEHFHSRLLLYKRTLIQCLWIICKPWNDVGSVIFWWLKSPDSLFLYVF